MRHRARTIDTAGRDEANRTIDRVRVRLGVRSYDIIIRERALDALGAALADCGGASRVALVTNPVVNRLWGAAAIRSLQAAGLPTTPIEIPPGERYKSLTTARRVYARLVEAGLDRRCAVVALGGGVVGDLAGFVAATYLRGVTLVQAPTTLLAQVDASVGGKVAVNLPQGKNLVGAFYQPSVVVVDVTTLGTLPRRQLRSGLAEVVKHGVIADAALFSYLESNATQAIAAEPATMRHLIKRSCEIKASVVALDEREAGRRTILNFGHTIGHALETHSRYRRFSHGAAVAVGMMAACRVGQHLGLMQDDTPERLLALLNRLGLSTHIAGVTVDDLLPIMHRDKKALAEEVRMVLPVRMGEVTVTPVSDDVLRAALGRWLGEG